MVHSLGHGVFALSDGISTQSALLLCDFPISTTVSGEQPLLLRRLIASLYGVEI